MPVVLPDEEVYSANGGVVRGGFSFVVEDSEEKYQDDGDEKCVEYHFPCCLR